MVTTRSKTTRTSSGGGAEHQRSGRRPAHLEDGGGAKAQRQQRLAVQQRVQVDLAVRTPLQEQVPEEPGPTAAGQQGHQSPSPPPAPPAPPPLPVEGRTVDGVDGAAGGSEGEDGGGPGSHRVAAAGHCSRCRAGEGAAQQQAALGAQQEGVGVPGGQSQRGQAHRSPPATGATGARSLPLEYTPVHRLVVEVHTIWTQVKQDILQQHC